MPEAAGINNPFDAYYGALLAQIKDMQARDAANHSIALQALQAGDISKDQYGEFLSMPHKKRTEFAADLAANFIERMKQGQQSISSPTPSPQGNVIVPVTGAAAYWYVDPRATMNDSERLAAIQTANELVPIPR